MTLATLPLQVHHLPVAATLREIARYFREYPLATGILLLEQAPQALVSRRRFDQWQHKGRDRPLREHPHLWQQTRQFLTLLGDLPLAEAHRLVLQRPEDEAREPLVVHHNHQWTLLDPWDLLLAQARYDPHQAQLTALVENLPIEFWVRDSQGRCLMQNQTSIEQWGNLIGTTPTEADIPPEVRAQWQQNNQRAQAGEVVQTEVQHNGRTYHKLVVPVLDKTGAWGSLGVNFDITSHRHLETALQAAEARYRSFFENAVEGIFQVRAQGYYLSVNPALVRLLGYDQPAELLTTSRAQGYVDPDRWSQLVAVLTSQGWVQQFESEVYRKDGGRIWVSENVRAVHDEQGTRYEGTMTDITGVKQAQALRLQHLEQQLILERAAVQMRELQKLNQLKDDFLSTVSHELRTPITNIKMAIYLLKDATTPEQRQRYLQVLEVECEREIQLIQDLLALQDLEPSFPTPISLAQWVPELLQPFAARTQQQQQTLQVTVEPVFLVSDRNSLAHILVELVNNACKYTPPGGAIQVQAQPAPYPAAVQIQVSNTGPEIPPEECERIFEKFYRIPSSDPWKQGGMGLGLALVQKRVLQLKGQITVASNPQQTTFAVTLPSLNDHT
ncbi:PAS domain-containing sensor histidine kinase [Candidatus Cyanaurora vandensis]|uniref:sensor histidine kinase n=1 Tax=Candidatus Cyanaurora vandensis TaxID=2714958 RepID=UPI002580366A|nr:PAS domain-containing sensor histidine kinase [Candidatus Cyanaurora vandensis]